MERIIENDDFTTKLLEKIDDIITRRSPETKEVWTLEDIAAYTGVKYSTVRDNITKRPNFPAPIRPMGTTYRIWKAADVKAWLWRQR